MHSLALMPTTAIAAIGLAAIACALDFLENVAAVLASCLSAIMLLLLVAVKVILHVSESFKEYTWSNTDGCH